METLIDIFLKPIVRAVAEPFLISKYADILTKEMEMENKRLLNKNHTNNNLSHRCNACTEIGIWRSDLQLYADDFCYEQYKKYKLIKK